VDIEPLAAAGGLSNNEVAELVYLEVQAILEPETEFADQNVAGNTEVRGVVGINLPKTRSAFPNDFPVQSDGTVIENNGFVDRPNPFRASTLTDDAYLQQFQVENVPPFDDETNGPGGGSTDHFYAEKQYRNLTNRGPVLDSNDDITVLATIVADDYTGPIEAPIRLHMLWDVAETSDAGRKFSVPR
jgi:hypothetical protein